MKASLALNNFLGGLVAISVAVLPGQLQATPISGFFTGANPGIVSIANLPGSFVGVNMTCLNWGYPAACQTTTGIPDSVSSSDVAVFTSGTSPFDTIKDVPASVALPLVDFETIQSPIAGSGGEVHFDLTGIVIPGAFGNCSSAAINNQCNPGGGSPFTLIQDTANEVTIRFAVLMNAYIGSNMTGVTPYNGAFSTNLSGNLPNGMPDTIPNILNYISNPNNTVTSTWSAQESPVPNSGVPEPATLFLSGFGLLGLSLVARRKRRT